MQSAMKFLLFAVLGLASMSTYASAALESLRVVPRENAILVVMELSAETKYKTFSLANPNRIVVDLLDSHKPPHSKWKVDKPAPVVTIRGAVRQSRNYRVVVDLSRQVDYEVNTYTLSGGRFQLLVRIPADGLQSVPPLSSEAAGDNASSKSKSSQYSHKKRPAEIIVAVDPGHGGKDPGAKGARGTLEKDVVLEISKRLAAEINREPGMRAVLTRSDDKFLHLRRRMDIARQHQADLFVSIHANSYKDPRVRGSSVFTLSQGAATSEAARWLAKKENSADLVGGVSISDKEDVVASVLLDLSQTVTNDASHSVAQEVSHSMGRVNKLHKKYIERAGFAVLKSPDIPSILVETMYLTNPKEEMMLRSKHHQNRMAKAIFKGIKNYFVQHPIEGTQFAARKHVIQRGETLYAIASHYRVSVENIRQFNHLKNDSLRIGQVLSIPL